MATHVAAGGGGGGNALKNVTTPPWKYATCETTERDPVTITAAESCCSLRIESSGAAPSSVTVTRGSIGGGGALVVQTSLHSPAAMLKDAPLG